MKKILFLFACTLVLALTSCDGEKKDDSQTTAAGMQLLDLSGYEFNFPLTLVVPDSTNGILDVTAQSWGAIEIKVGDDFQISVEEGDGENDDLSLVKSTEIEATDAYKVKRYITDEPTLLVYESQMLGAEDKTSYHFYGVFKIGDKNYVVEDLKGNVYSEAAVTKMLESAKSLKLKEKANS